MENADIEHRQGMEIPGNRIILAFDAKTDTQIVAAIEAIPGLIAGGKVNDKIDRDGASALSSFGLSLVMADPKLHDIPQTVYNRMKEYRGHATFVTVHASNQWQSLLMARKAANEIGVKAIAVTILTSMSTSECKRIYGMSARRKVLQLADRAMKAGLHGIVCSPKEVKAVRKLWPTAIIICPGVRSEDVIHHDQKRVDTPYNAILNGADFVVIGREILGQMNSTDMRELAGRIQAMISNALLAKRMKSGN